MRNTATTPRTTNIMSEFAEEFRTMVLARPEIAAVIGTRLYQITIPESETQFPSCAYQVGLNDFYEAHEGSTGLATTLITIGCVARSYGATLSLANLIKSYLNNFKGMVGATKCQLIQYQDSRQMKDDELDLSVIELDFIAHIEPLT